MLRRTIRLITVLTLAATISAGIVTVAVVVARSAATRLLETAASGAGVELEYRRLRLSLVHGVVLREVSLTSPPHGVRVEAGRVRINRRRIEGFALHIPDAPLAGLDVGVDRVFVTFAERVATARIPPVASARLDGLHALFTLRDPPSAPEAAPEFADAAGIRHGSRGDPASDPTASLSTRPRSAPEDPAVLPFPGLAAAEAAVLDALRGVLPILPETVSAHRARVDVERIAQDENGAPRVAERFGFSIRDALLRTDARDRSVHLDAQGAWAAGGRDGWSVEMTVSPDEEVWSGSLSIRDLEIASVAFLLPAGSMERPGGLLEVGIDIERSPRSETSAVSGVVALAGGSMVVPSVSESPLELADARYEFALRSDMTAPLPRARLARRIPGTTDPPPPGAGAPEDAELRGEIVFESGVIRLGAVAMELAPAFRGYRDHGAVPARVDLRLSLPGTPVQRIIDALPQALLGPLAGLVVDGVVSWDLDLEAPTSGLSWTGWDASTSLEGFDIVDIPAAYDVRRLNGEFLYRLPGLRTVDRFVVIPAFEGGSLPGETGVTAADGASAVPPSPRAGSGSPGSGWFVPELIGAARVGMVHPVTIDLDYRYAPLSYIAPWMISAAITSEDGEYYRHDGINWLQAKSALERNVAAGEIVVGASTIQMQLAKNLFLDHERTIVRKLQEVGFVALMQLGADLSRERMMELYLNIVEFGPGIHGIEHAARYYFGKAPQALSVAEAVWLATALPSPSRRHSQFKNGAVPPAWLAHMRAVMALMLERGRLTPEQHARGVLEVPRFRP